MELSKQKEIYKFLKDYTENKGYPPSVREICEAVSLTSTSTVHGHLQRLERKGLIKRDPTKPRALEILELSTQKKEMINIPIVGKITDELPILAAENIEGTFQVPLNFIKHNGELFVLKVSGESMVNAGIRNNDFAIIESSENARNGEIVAALINKSVTIKRLFKEKEHVRLQPENDTMNSIMVDDCKILGKVVGTFRSFE